MQWVSNKSGARYLVQNESLRDNRSEKRDEQRETSWLEKEFFMASCESHPLFCHPEVIVIALKEPDVIEWSCHVHGRCLPLFFNSPVAAMRAWREIAEFCVCLFVEWEARG